MDEDCAVAMHEWTYQHFLRLVLVCCSHEPVKSSTPSQSNKIACFRIHMTTGSQEQIRTPLRGPRDQRTNEVVQDPI